MKLRKGITYSHEHITIDLSGPKNDPDCNLKDKNQTILELKNLKSKGVENIIDVTNRGMGRNVEYVQRVMEEAQINILSSTGYYKEPFFPDEVSKLNEKELYKIMRDEIIYGIDGGGAKAEVIGEIGTGRGEITELEKKVFRAASRAHVETGKPIITHTTLGSLGLEQIAIFKEQCVNLDKVILSHVDLSNDLNYILRLIDKGVYVAFDTIGKIKYLAEEKRMLLLKELCSRGLSDRILMSMDLTRKSHLLNGGGIGYAYLLDTFIPYLIENGVESRDIENMTVKNSTIIFG